MTQAVVTCLHPNTYLDRTLCACGRMHFYCDVCGRRVSACRLDTRRDIYQPTGRKKWRP